MGRYRSSDLQVAMQAVRVYYGNMPIPNPVAFTIFGLDIMWYAILICFGIVIATVLCCRRAPLHGFTSDQVLNMVIISVPAGIIGARLYYVLFHWSWYSGDLSQIFNTRAGGLAIHGGLILGLATAAILCKRQRMSPLSLLDLIAPAIALGQSIGRWGNYFNSEAHGGPTDLPLAVTIDGQQMHPTFLYESIWCFLLFIFLLWFDSRQLAISRSSSPNNGQAARTPDNGQAARTPTSDPETRDPYNDKPGSGFLRPFEGQIFLLYAILYSIERFFVEALRTDSLMIGPFKQAQVISLVATALALIVYVYLSRRANRSTTN